MGDPEQDYALYVNGTLKLNEYQVIKALESVTKVTTVFKQLLQRSGHPSEFSGIFAVAVVVVPERIILQARQKK